MATKLLTAFAVAVASSAPVAHAAGESQLQSFVDEVQTGIATYYARKFEGRRTASGETFRNDALTAAHSSLPFGTMVLVTCVERGRSVLVRITDRLPSKRAIIDLSQSAAAQLKMMTAGRTKVTVRVLTKDQAHALRDAAKDARLGVTAATELLSTVLGDDSR
jgi:rare lipoprotein A